jgi:hypothetical protein
LALKHEFQLQTFEERAIENTSVLLIFWSLHTKNLKASLPAK